jgi:hypothetical protein
MLFSFKCMFNREIVQNPTLLVLNSNGLSLRSTLLTLKTTFAVGIIAGKGSNISVFIKSCLFNALLLAKVFTTFFTFFTFFTFYEFWESLRRLTVEFIFHLYIVVISDWLRVDIRFDVFNGRGINTKRPSYW